MGRGLTASGAMRKALHRSVGESACNPRPFQTAEIAAVQALTGTTNRALACLERQGATGAALLERTSCTTTVVIAQFRVQGMVKVLSQFATGLFLPKNNQNHTTRGTF